MPNEQETPEKKIVDHGLPTQQEGAPQQPFDTPPGAPPPLPGMPLQPGKPIRVNRPTVMELNALLDAGWKQGDPVPENIAAFIQQAAQVQGLAQTGPDIQLPSSADSPGPAQEDALSNAQIEAAREALQQSRTDVEQARATEAAHVPGAGPGVNEAIQMAREMPGLDEAVVVDDTAETEYDSGPPKISEELKEEDKTVAPPSPQRCPRCDWDLNVLDPIAVTDADKQRFLQALLGLTLFQKFYSLFNGTLRILFRSLTPGELDMCFEQCFYERKQGQLESPDAYFEQVNRYRLCLQLVRVETAETIHNFPQSMNEWKQKIQAPIFPSTRSGEAGSDQTQEDLPVKQICKEIYNSVITSETLNRVIASVAMEFNSLVAKLEANASNPDFWLAAK